MGLIPLLPQNDPDIADRKAELLEEQTKYQYNYTCVAPLPMVEQLPLAELPSLRWLLRVLDASAKLLLNALQEKHQTSLFDAFDDLNRYATFIKLLKSNNPKQVEQGLKDIFSAIQSAQVEGPGNSWAEYEEIFRSIPLPTISKTFKEDAEFAWFRVAGPNPLVIAQVTELSQLAWLSEARYQAVFPGDTLAEAVASGQLYLADYSVLKTVEAGSFPNQQKYLTAPLALFAVKSGALTPVAIQIDKTVFTPTADDESSNAYWTWLMAKTTVQIADANYHELISHLGRTHLVIEPFVIATHRQLAANHPLNLLLVPHFEGTLNINDLAQKTLIQAGGSVDQLLAGTIGASRTLSVQAVQTFGFNDQMLPDTFKRRGVADKKLLPDYPYRDDGLLIWQAIETWVTNYLSIYYHDDTDVAGDTELQAWAKELLAEDGGRLMDFGQGGEIKTLTYLIQAVTLIIFTGSAQHAAVNFTQASLMSFVPPMPMAGYTMTKDNATKQDYFNLLPPISQAQGQLTLTYLLGTVCYTKLGDYTDLIDPRIQDALTNFRDQLKAVEGEIKAVNEDRNHRYEPYTYLLPSLIPQSINI